MVLSFSRNFPWGGPTNFVDKIKAGTKIHTIRGMGGIQPGHKINFWENSLRNKESNPKEFYIENREVVAHWEQRANKDTGLIYDDPILYATENIIIFFPQLERGWRWKTFPETIKMKVCVSGLWLDDNTIELLATNDGLTVRELAQWFFYSCKKKNRFSYAGQIKHWTDKVYFQEQAKTIHSLVK